MSPLRSYLYQADIANVLESIQVAVDALIPILPSIDPFLKEDLESQKAIIHTDRAADGVQLRRLLRDSFRKEPVEGDLSRDEQQVLIGALKIELSSSSISPDMVQLYEQVLARIETEPVQQIDEGSSDVVFQDLTGKIVRVSDAPIAWGAVTSVWSGELFGKPVSIFTSVHTSHSITDDLATLKAGIPWSAFHHKNVLPLLGIIRNFGKYNIGLVTPWMTNGTVMEYVSENPGADRLKIITDFATGLAYLHSLNPPYVHGILTETVLLIDEHGNGLLAGFASAMFESSCITGLRFRAPETYSSVQNGQKLSTDIYSFAMVLISILTGHKPFSNYSRDMNIVTAVKNGQRPPHPSGSLVHPALDDGVWAIIIRCWAQNPDDRPTASQIVRELEDLRRLPDLDVPDLTNLVFLNDSIHVVLKSGGFGDVRRGNLHAFGPVALNTCFERPGSARTTGNEEVPKRGDNMEQASTSKHITLPWYHGHHGTFYMSCVALDAKRKLHRIFENKGSGESYTNNCWDMSRVSVSARAEPASHPWRFTRSQRSDW